MFAHNYTTSLVDTAVACVKAGCNLELSGAGPVVYESIGMTSPLKMNVVFVALVTLCWYTNYAGSYWWKML